MKRLTQRLLACCLMVAMLLTGALAETVNTVDYTVAEKFLKQLQVGSGFTGTLTAELTAVAGREGEAVTTPDPLSFDFSYINVWADTTTQTDAENRITLALMNGDEALSSAELSVRDGVLYAQSALLGDGWYRLDVSNAVQVKPTQEGAANALTQTANTLLSESGMPGLATFAATVLSGLNQMDTAQMETSLETYTTKIDLWIEAYRQKAVLGKTADGTTTMQVDYQIPATAIKSQLKQLLMDLLADTQLLPIIKAALPEAVAKQYLDPQMQAYYFYTVDELPLNGDLLISRTVSLMGETLALSMSLPLYDSEGGAITVRYERTKGEGDLPDQNSIELLSDAMQVKADYQTYNTLTGTTVYQGTLLRKPLGLATFEVDAATTLATEAQKTFSAVFTLSHLESVGTDEEGKDTQTSQLALTLTPEYTPDTPDDDATVPNEQQSQQYIVFDPLDVKLDTTFTSGQAKSASTAVDITLSISGERMAQSLTLQLSGKTRGKWTPQAISTTDTIAVETMAEADLQSLLVQAGLKAGVLLLPYISLPTATSTSIVEATPAP